MATIKPSIQLRMGQQLTMTPQLQQAIRLLQLSSLELAQEIQQALESNVMLELAEEVEQELEEEAPAEAVSGADDEAAEGIDGEALDGDEASALEATNEEGTQAPSDPGAEAAASEDIPEELPVDTDWEDIYDVAPASGPPPESALAGQDLEARRSAEEGLREHLLWQLNLTPMGDLERACAAAVIDALDDDGYLCEPLDEVRETVARHLGIPVEPEQMATALALVQSFDPPGVGARDLAEALLLQLRLLPEDTPFLDAARTLVGEYLDVLGRRDFNQLMRRLELSREELRQVVALVQSLNPRPGAHLQPNRAEYVVPDVIVRKAEGRWVVELNPDAVPALRVNQRYARLIKGREDEAAGTLKAQLQEARWLIKSLQSRSDTLLRVATAIVERQQGFLEHGDEAMKPLVLHDIADALGLHESTISRVTTRKYMATPRGIYELKYFFSSHVATAEGGEASSTAIRAQVRKLIAAEDPTRPLSDSRIAAILSEKGIKVARRTIAKYREAMRIPPSSERKRLA